ncbi:uncharacterized protein LOC108110273 [Drosophila eugracilis]|uniref:uncharacterized protein LOC108110273 n=1 Tax=Drosophila eugracilis TaxID=29029 RepID=UPI0007E76F5D|nr:uncharacterized protein LOC108110273 [Drosophila eugracilis]
MRNICWLLAVPMAILPLGCAIVGTGRDFLLTPKHGHQLTGKRIFYEEPTEAKAQNQRRNPLERPWERTLKHVTYVTLFTDSAVGAAAGNLSQLHEYHDFLQTPYVPADAQGGAAIGGGTPSARFGDIITLAKGYLEQLPGSGNASYRFLEGGTCFQLKCPTSNPNQRRALWQVQRIRHRDGDTGRHYHYEMKFSVTPLDNKAWQPHHQMSYIQKESDYPASFGRLTHDQGFAQRRQDRERYASVAAAPNAEQSQATFVHGIFQPAPSPPKLNIGEYLKGAVGQGSPKIEIFPGLFNLALRPNYVAPTTFRPNYPVALKFGTHSELERFPGHNSDLVNAGHVAPGEVASTPGAVTHHFHHHFYVAPGAGENPLHPELAYRLPSSTPPELTTPVSNTASSFYPHHQTVQFPNSNSGSSESLEEQEQDLLLRTPQIYGQASKYQTAKVPPLLIYAGGSSGDEDKSFVQSEPLEETVYRYSEPDPLYMHQNPIDVLQDKQPHEEDIAGVQDAEQENYQERNKDKKHGDQRPVSSLEQPELVTTVAPTTPATTSSTTTTETTTTERTTHVIPTTSASFVSTSTHFSPLRSISRYRTTPQKITAGRSTTTTTSTSTEPPLSKWAKRRKEQDSKAKSSHRHEAFVSTTSTSSTTTTQTPHSTTTVTATPPAPPPPPAPPKVVEVLTQKSVSRSVSIKVGENGEEIPIIVDDEENEVKPVPNK